MAGGTHRVHDELSWLTGFSAAAVERARHNLIDLTNRPADAAALINSRSIQPYLDVCDLRGRAIGQARSERRRFMTDVLSLMARNVWQRTDFNVTTTLAAKEFIAEHLDRLTSGADRFAVAREVLRRVMQSNFKAVATTPAFLTYIQLTLAPTTIADRINADQLRSALNSADQHLARKRSNVYFNSMRLFGLRIKGSEATADDLTLVVSATVLGLSLRSLLTPEQVDRTLDWNGDDYHLSALAVIGIVDNWLELDPDYDHVSALNEYLREGLRSSRSPSKIVQIPRRDP